MIVFLKPKTYNLKPVAGQAVLSLVLLVGGMVAFVSVTLAFIALSFVNSSTGFVRANRARAAASAGIEDAALRLLRNKDFSAPSAYSIPVGQYAAEVTVTQGSPAAGQVTVISDAVVLSYERKIRAVFAVAPATGEVQLISWGEMSL